MVEDVTEIAKDADKTARALDRLQKAEMQALEAQEKARILQRQAATEFDAARKNAADIVGAARESVKQIHLNAEAALNAAAKAEADVKRRENKLQKDLDKLAADREVLKRDRKYLDDRHAALTRAADDFQRGAIALVDTVKRGG